MRQTRTKTIHEEIVVCDRCSREMVPDGSDCEHKDKAVQAAKRGLGVSPIYLDEDDQPEQSNVIYMRGRRRRRIVFGWYGGKFSHLDWLLPLLPKCHHR
jgi:DNA adenine methylase